MPKCSDWCVSVTEQYILHGDEIYAVLNRLVNHKKKLFLITNSPFSFVWVPLLLINGTPWHSKSCAGRSLLWAPGICVGQGFVAVVMELSGSCLWWMLHPQHWSYFFKQLQAVTRLWVAITLQSWLFLLPLAVFAASQTSLGFPWCRRKCSINTSYNETALGDSQICFLLCYWNKSEFRAYCCKDAVLGEKSTGSINFSVPLGTKEWNTWLARTGGIYSTWSLCKRTSPTSSLTDGSTCPGHSCLGLGPSCRELLLCLTESRGLLSIV